MNDRSSVFAALRREQEEAIAFWGSLSPAELARPSLCKGWSVKDVAIHTIIGENEVFLPQVRRALEGRGAEPPPGFNLVESNEEQIARNRSRPMSELIEEAKRIVEEVHETLALLSEEQWNAPAWNATSPGTLGFFTRGRIWEWWTHDQDIRVPLKRPGGRDPSRVRPVVEVVRDGITGVFLPEKAKGVRVSYAFQAGETGFTVRIADGHCEVENAFDPRATSRVKADPATFVLVGTGRVSQMKAVLTGKFKPSGNPFAGLKFLHYFRQP